MKDTKISWCNHTFNGWIGCTKVSEGCSNCYAESLMQDRFRQAQWGKGKPRVKTGEGNWKAPLKWHKDNVKEFEFAARGFGRSASSGYRLKARPTVFCSSLSDVFDPEVPDIWRFEIIELIHSTWSLDWLLLTKRPDQAVRFYKHYSKISSKLWPPNLWMGTSIESEKHITERLELLKQVPAMFHFASCEPLLGPLEFSGMEKMVDWVIVGGESGAKARPLQKVWVLDIKKWCEDASIPFFFKQWGGTDPQKGGDLISGYLCQEFPSSVAHRNMFYFPYDPFALI